MKNVISFRKGVLGLAIAGLAGTALLAGTSLSAATATLISNDDISQVRDFETFSKIRVKGAIELHLTAGGEQKVTVTTDEDHIDEVETYVRGDTLIIDMSDKRRNFWNNVDVEVTISLATLSGLDVRGAIDAKLMNLDSPSLDIEVKGAGDIDMDGTCGDLNIDVKGAGDIEAKELQCDTVDVNMKGAGSASVYASKSVDADVSGVGSIQIYGHPKSVSKSVGGIGSINIR